MPSNSFITAITSYRSWKNLLPRSFHVNRSTLASSAVTWAPG